MSKSHSEPIHEAIFKIADTFPKRIAIALPSASICYGDLSRLIRSFAVRFKKHGINRNSTVAVWDIGGFAFTLSALAISLLGGRRVAASKFAIILGPQLGISHHIRNVHTSSAEQFDNTILIDDNWLTKLPRSLPKWTEFEGPSSSEATYMIAQSSGSTGAPKFMELSHSLTNMRFADGENFEFFKHDRFASLFKTDSFPGHSTLLRVLRSGATFIGGQDPAFHIARGTEVFFGSPAQYRSFIERITVGSPKFKRAIVGGAPMTAAFLRRARSNFEIITNVIGSTEVGYLAAIDVDREDMDIRCVGRPIGTVEVQIVDRDHQPLRNGQEGIIRIRSTRSIKSYVVKSESDKDVFRDGFFYPGDMGFMDEIGQLYVVGRVKDHFNLGGTKVNASRVDEMLSNLQGVKDAMAFMDVDDEGFDILAAVILSDDDILSSIIIDEIKNLQGKVLFKFDIPRRIYFVNELPRNDNGKLMRMTAQNLIEGVPMHKIW